MSELPFSESARRHLESLSEHPHAPRYNFSSSDLLDSNRLGEVKDFALTDRLFWREGEVPEWIRALTERVFRTVPFYREMGDAPANFQAVPPISRAELAELPERLVPDDVSLEELTIYTTSGTTGSAVKIPTDPAVSSKTLVLMEQMMSRFGARFPRGPGEVALAALFYQDKTLTYPSLSRYLNEAATLKLNLHENDWRDPGDRGAFLEQLAPAVITGCPFSLSVAADCAPGLSPQAVFSSATPLSDGLRLRLGEVFGCPVFDVYSLTEAKFIAARSDGPGHDLLGSDVYVEILDPEGRILPCGEKGEITVTSGRNKCLPLLRYRTGDFASLEFRGSQPYLRDLEGRRESRLTDGAGRERPALDLVNALRELPVVGFSFRQSEDRTYQLSYCGQVEPKTVRAALETALGLKGEVSRMENWEGKPHQF